MTWATILDPAFTLRVCMTLAHSIWQVALFAAIAWGLDWFWRRRSVEGSYAVYVAALLAGLAAMPVTYAIVDVGMPGAAVPTETVDAGLPARPPVALTLENPQGVIDQGEQTPKAGTFSPGANAMAIAPPGPAAGDPSARWFKVAHWIVTLYTAGVLFMLVRLIRGIWHARRLSSGAKLIGDGPLLETLNRLARKWSMRIVPLLARAEGIVVPKLVGLVRPMILLPVSAITCLSMDELEMILAHELAHVRRFDTWVNLAQRVAEVVLFFNPALWYLSRRTSALREYCCDELTCRASSGSDVELRTRYASALVRIVELGMRSPACRSQARALGGSDLAALAASGRSPSDLRRRVCRLFGEPLREPVRLSRGGLLALGVLAALLLVVPTVLHSEKDFAAAPMANMPNHGAEMDSSAKRSLFAELSEKYRSNLGRIHTWTGKVDIEDSHQRLTDNATTVIQATVTFASDERRRTNKTVKEVHAFYEEDSRGNRKSFPRENRSLLLKAGEIFSSSTNGNPGSPDTPSLRQLRVGQESNAIGADEVFLPALQAVDEMAYAGYYPGVYFPSLLKASDRQLADISVSRNGNIVGAASRLEKHGILVFSNRREFDLGRGGSLIRFEYDAPGIQRKDRWTCEPQNVDGIWIPKRVEFTIEAKGNGFVQTKKMEWRDQVLNRDLAMELSPTSAVSGKALTPNDVTV